MTAAVLDRSVVMEEDLPYSAALVWRALTEGPLLAEWLMENDFRPVLGHRFTFRTAPVAHWNGVVDCVVKAIEPAKRLAFSWESSGVNTLVTFTLTPTPRGVRLRMEQSGFGPDQDRNLAGARYGWQTFLGKLRGVAARLAAEG
ncbi:MAG: SRPBCC domain-containing protein [Bauldia sp.]